MDAMNASSPTESFAALDRLDASPKQAIASWEFDLRNLLDRAARRLGVKLLPLPYEKGFPEDYRSKTPARRAVRDALNLDAAAKTGRCLFDIRSLDAAENCRQLVLYSATPYDLDEVLPVLRNLGLRVLDQIQCVVDLGDRRLFMRNFRVAPTAAPIQALVPRKAVLAQAMDALLSDQIDDDALNGLMLRGGLGWWEVGLLRAYCSYYLQIRDRFERGRIHAVLLDNAEMASLLLKYFEARFEPDPLLGDAAQRESGMLTQLRLDLINALEKVADVAEDRILRDLFNLIDATLRTNFYLPQARDKRYIALKIGSLGVISMPSPRPLVEIYVHAHWMEGVHLRGARIARGGIRWSERLEDFRGEILELMQTQTIKNALIVPQGAKGGFILKSRCADGAQRTRMAQSAYDLFIRGLLDLTDNVQAGDTKPPARVLCYDDADPYLVVAADKGTANMSDRANEIAAEYGYWLGDAFATGGSHGFHHKSLGVTARGTWVCVKRHFYELGLDIDERIFSVVGVGGMEGDVFGNGMLASRNIRLLAAFDADFIFIDPNPNREASHVERKRLFETPGSRWRDYNPALISAGGGVFPRGAKNIVLSAEIREWLGARSVLVDGDELIRLLLSAPVDLLWLGGIGTYVKASTESNEAVGDRANDGARVDAKQIRAKVVGEGANLGFTQRARIEYALKGGRINSDAIDNSAGVDLSDHEVNLKILLSPGASAGQAGRNERDDLLRELADEVCLSVLNGNYSQSLCLSLERERSLADVAPFLDVADLLENAELLDRSLEAFPLRKEVAIREVAGLTRAELAVLTARSKLALKRAVLETTDFLDSPWAQAFFADYFPPRVRARDRDGFKVHLLRREIAATAICNKVIDQAGATFLVGFDDFDPRRASQAIGLYLAFDQILQGERWRDAVRSLDGKMAAERQYELLLQLEDALAFLCRWAWRHGRRLTPDAQIVEAWRADLQEYLNYLGQSPEFSVLTSAAPDASRQLFLNRLRDFPAIVELSRSCEESLTGVLKLFEDFRRLLGLRQIAALASEVAPRDVWERRLQGSLDDQLRSAAARLVRTALRTKIRDGAEFFRQFALETRLAKFHGLRLDLVEAGAATLTPIAAIVGELDSVVDACAAVSGAY